MFVVVLAISYIERRLWCRHLCPLGALLGLMGRGALFGRVVDEDKCTSCEACERACPMDAIRDDGRSTDTSRCECGLECADACAQGAIRWGYKPRKQYEYDPSRRALLKGAGLAFVGGFFLVTGLGRIQRKISLIRPPGARTELDFLATCARCGQCLKVCPTNVLQPAVFEAGVEGMFTPSLDFRRGYCEWNCNECGKVCPTQAIQKLDLPREAADGHRPGVRGPQHLHTLVGGRGVPGLPGAVPDPVEGHHPGRGRRGGPGRPGRPRRGGRARQREPRSGGRRPRPERRR